MQNTHTHCWTETKRVCSQKAVLEITTTIQLTVFEILTRSITRLLCSPVCGIANDKLVVMATATTIITTRNTSILTYDKMSNKYLFKVPRSESSSIWSSDGLRQQVGYSLRPKITNGIWSGFVSPNQNLQIYRYLCHNLCSINTTSHIRVSVRLTNTFRWVWLHPGPRQHCPQTRPHSVCCFHLTQNLTNTPLLSVVSFF